MHACELTIKINQLGCGCTKYIIIIPIICHSLLTQKPP